MLLVFSERFLQSLTKADSSLRSSNSAPSSREFDLELVDWAVVFGPQESFELQVELGATTARLTGSLLVAVEVARYRNSAI